MWYCNSLAGLSNIPSSSQSPECVPHYKENKENNLTQEDESSWLHRNDAYHMQQIAGRIRAVTMPLASKTKPIKPIITDIARGNDQTDDPYGIFEPVVEQANLDDYLEPLPNGQAAYHEPDEEARIYMDRGVAFESYQLGRNTTRAPHMSNTDEFIYQNLPIKHHVLRKVADCLHCGALRFPFEGPAFCCRKGKVGIFTPEVPEELKRLFTSQEDEDAKYFRENIRYFNSHFSFTSLGVTLDRRVSTTAGTRVYTFRACGGLYHALDNLVPADNGPRHLQLYIYDTDQDLVHRATRSPDLNIDLIRKILQILERNPYAQTFKSLGSIPNLDEYRISLNTDINLDQRRYNAPTTSQVAAIWVEGSDPQNCFDRSVVVHGRKGDRPLYIRAYYGCYDPLSYPLFFPYGETGWNRCMPYVGATDDTTQNTVHVSAAQGNQASALYIEENLIIEREQDENFAPHEPDNPAPQGNPAPDLYTDDNEDNQDEDFGDDEVNETQSRKFVSAREYYCFKLQVRKKLLNIILFGGRLFQQWAIDMYIKIETMRLDWYSKPENQKVIRADLYQGLVDTVVAGESRGDRIGKRIVLPRTFPGGDRDMQRRFLDAMAIVQRWGKPDYFITMTCNPYWEEITEKLLPGQLPQDRPDLVARVYKAKQRDMMDLLTKGKHFGEVAAYVHVIEFQKRGLPHEHILLIMKAKSKLATPDDYDRVICAEIPDKEKHPVLHDLVVKHMLHGPCGELKKSCPCMIDGQCRFHYPRDFCDATQQGKDSYPIYRRRDDGRRIRIRGADLDNRWVVPYNPSLLMRYNCHINVEACSNIKAVKYLFKYIYKGHDRTSFAFEQDIINDGGIINEIRQYRDARYVSPPEAIYRIFRFKMFGVSPSVLQLQLHLPNMHTVAFKASENLEDVVSRPSSSKSMLTEYFEMNQKFPAARKWLYREFPEHYRWIAGKKFLQGGM
ncbi:uncharacterized protein [Triticum aestivum]|uniref:uncharacterized protein n=1 Tax=Triticum aestivum TaxID=4565 RepID=UPI001D007BEC|nr:uncharacterized protein LOC123082673 [Triticum aestivum]